jgi:hypothetical protein
MALRIYGFMELKIKLQVTSLHSDCRVVLSVRIRNFTFIMRIFFLTEFIFLYATTVIEKDEGTL